MHQDQIDCYGDDVTRNAKKQELLRFVLAFDIDELWEKRQKKYRHFWVQDVAEKSLPENCGSVQLGRLTVLDGDRRCLGPDRLYADPDEITRADPFDDSECDGRRRQDRR